MSRPIDDVDFESFLNQILEPSGPAVRRPHPVGTLTAATVHEHDRERMSDDGGNHVLDVHLLPADKRAARGLGAPHVHPHVAPFGDVERNFGSTTRGLLRQCGGISGRGQRCQCGGRGSSGTKHDCTSHEGASIDGRARVVFVECSQIARDLSRVI
jgi:hypothetical protein